MPTWSTLTPWRIPGGFVRFTWFPKYKICVAFLKWSYINSISCYLFFNTSFRKTSIIFIRRNMKQNMTVNTICIISVNQFCNCINHFFYITCCFRLNIGVFDPNLLHIFIINFVEFLGNFSKWCSCFYGFFYDFVVNICNI